MARIALLVNPARAEAVRLVDHTVQRLEAAGHQTAVIQLPVYDGSGAPTAADGNRSAVSRLPLDALEGAAVAVSVGGDGTFLRLVPLAYRSGVPLLGVNFGRLGYLLAVQPTVVDQALERVLRGDVAYEERTVLEVRVGPGFEHFATDDRSLPADGSSEGPWWVALNEAVVEKTVPGHMVHLTTTIDDHPCLRHRADGVLVATATGSTAYNLSAGGPVLAPGMRAIIVTPVAPHGSIDRSLVLEPSSVVTVTVERPRPAVLVIDGRAVGLLAAGTAVECRVAARPVRLVSFGDRDLADLLRMLSPDRV